MDSHLNETLFGKHEPISAGLLSRKFLLPIEEAREALLKFQKSAPSQLSASFVVSGIQTDPVGKRGPIFRIVSESQVENEKQGLEEPVTVQIYSLSPNNASDSALLVSLARQQRDSDTRASIDELKSVGFLMSPLVADLRPRTKMEAAPLKTELKAEPLAPKAVELKNNPVEGEVKSKAPLKAPSKSNSPFARVSKEQAMSKAFDRRPNQTAVAEKVVVADDVDDEDDDGDQEHLMEVDENDSEEQRKRLETLFDEPDAMQISESEAEQELDSEPEPEPEDNSILEVDQQSKISQADCMDLDSAGLEAKSETKGDVLAEPAQPLKNRKKVVKRTHTTDENGDIITVSEEVWVSCSDDEKEVKSVGPSDRKPATKLSEAKQSKPALPKIPKRSTQQATLMNFFSKKP